MQNPRVTIAIPVYNGSNYLRESVESALGQTYANVEVIVVNDGSTDNGATEAIARQYGSRIRYISQENKGVAGAMNTAIANMTGDFFTWLSHDDIHLPNKVERQIAFHQELKKPDAILFGNYDLIDAEGKKWHSCTFDRKRFIEQPMLPLLNGCINGCTLFIPAHILRDFGPFDEGLRYTQDYELWNKILSRYEFFFQPETLIRYRIHPGQDTNKPGAVIEGDELWVRMIESRSETERVQLFGSTKKFFSSMAEFLEPTPYRKAAQHARERALGALRGTLVSVVVPFFNEVELVLKAAHSALDQTHTRVQLVLVDDGSTADTSLVKALAKSDERVLLLTQPNGGPGSARNRGMRAADGDYIAFLDADDLFLSYKIQRQLTAMQDGGFRASHTSYHVTFPERYDRLGMVDSGKFSGWLYPKIIRGCPIATPTVMLHRSLVSEGFSFPTDTDLAEDVLSWVWVAQRHEFLGIDEPLTIVEWSSGSAALNIGKAVRGVAQLTGRLRGDVMHSRYVTEITELEKSLRDLLALHGAVYGNPSDRKKDVLLLEATVDSAFGRPTLQLG